MTMKLLAMLAITLVLPMSSATTTCALETAQTFTSAPQNTEARIGNLHLENDPDAGANVVVTQRGTSVSVHDERTACTTSL